VNLSSSVNPDEKGQAMFSGTVPDEQMAAWEKDFFPVVPTGVSGISCSPDYFAVIQGNRRMMTQTDISATSFKGTGILPRFLRFHDFAQYKVK